MARAGDEVPDVVLAVYAHPDDADVACGGTLARGPRPGAGSTCWCAPTAGGARPTRRSTPAELARRRAAELAEAAGAGRAGLAPGAGLRRRRARTTARPPGRAGRAGSARLRPEAVLGHDPTAVFFGQDYFNHRDHRAAGWALLDAVAPAAALPHYFPEPGPPTRSRPSICRARSSPTCGWTSPGPSTSRWRPSSATAASSPSGAGWAGEAVRRRAEEEGRRAGVRVRRGVPPAAARWLSRRWTR